MTDYILPEISWTSTSPEAIAAEIISRYETAAGRTLYPGDPLRLELLTIAQQIVQERALLDDAAAQTFLAYARALYLDVIGESRGVSRLAAGYAECLLQFTGAAGTTVPAGTRATKDGTVVFATVEAAIIPLGGTTVSVTAQASAAGTEANGYLIGEITTMVDSIAGITAVANTSQSAGGVAPEDDERYRERIRLSITSYSTAGPRDAYAYHALSASSQVSDITVTSPSPGQVDIYILLADGVIPEAEADIIDTVLDYISDETRRPLTDQVTVKAPTAVPYDVEVTYYLPQSSAVSAVALQAAVEAAIADYIAWQRARIGRDINPDELIRRAITAGAKRVEIVSPAYAVLDDTEVAQDDTTSITYGGLEDE